LLKINFDGAFSQEERKGAWGFIVRDHDGLAMLASAGRINVLHDALSAEIHGCLAALTAAMDQSMSHIILESDSTILVQALQSSDYDFSAASVLIREAKFLISMNFVHVDVVRAPRSCNSCAHELARVGTWINSMSRLIPSQSLYIHG
jgi:ribonuclease HI